MAADTDRSRDNEDKNSPRRKRTSAQPNIENKSLTRSPLIDTLFRAHLFATRFQEPQTRAKRRAGPADANANQRKTAKRPAKSARSRSKKV